MISKCVYCMYEMIQHEYEKRKTVWDDKVSKEFVQVHNHIKQSCNSIKTYSNII